MLSCIGYCLVCSPYLMIRTQEGRCRLQWRSKLDITRCILAILFVIKLFKKSVYSAPKCTNINSLLYQNSSPNPNLNPCSALFFLSLTPLGGLNRQSLVVSSLFVSLQFLAVLRRIWGASYKYPAKHAMHHTYNKTVHHLYARMFRRKTGKTWMFRSGTTRLGDF